MEQIQRAKENFKDDIYTRRNTFTKIVAAVCSLDRPKTNRPSIQVEKLIPCLDNVPSTSSYFPCSWPIIRRPPVNVFLLFPALQVISVISVTDSCMASCCNDTTSPVSYLYRIGDSNAAMTVESSQQN